MIPEVLVVDDNASAAEGYASLITLKAGIGTLAVASPSQALEAARNYPIKIFVLDQKMPQKSGTALFEELRAVNPIAKAIMLTGEADAEEIGDALQMGYSSYIHKSRVSELPGQVLVELLRYHNSVGTPHANPDERLVASVKKGIWRRDTISVYFLSSVVLDETFVDEKQWITKGEVRAGETIKMKDKISFEEKIRIDASLESKISSGVHGGVAGAVLKAKLESYLKTKFQTSATAAHKSSHEVEREYSLPKEPEKPDDNFVVSRAYQRAPVYRKIQTFFEVKCSMCERDEKISVIVLEPTRFIATRLVDLLLRGGTRILESDIMMY